jgi:type III pantothenate kinase
MNDALLIDLGNSRLKWAWSSTPDQFEAIAYDRKEPNFSEFFAAIGNLSEAMEVWLSSVAGTAGEQLTAAFLERGVSAIQTATSHRHLAGVENAYAEPARLGVDRFLGLIGVAQRYRQRDVLIAMAGTALTIDFLDHHGVHQGGVIAPGPSLMLQSLQHNTARLGVDVALTDQRPDFARDTSTAMRLGVIRACCGAIEQQLQLAKRMVGRDVQLILSGGAAPMLISELQLMLPMQSNLAGIELVPALVLHGLATYRACIADIR